MSLQVGDKIPEFKLYNYDKNAYENKDFLGKKTMFVFLPFPFSSVCDKEICELRDNKVAIEENGTETIIITVGASPTNNAWANITVLNFQYLQTFGHMERCHKSLVVFMKRLVLL